MSILSKLLSTVGKTVETTAKVVEKTVEKTVDTVGSVFRQAEELIEEEREYPVPESILNNRVFKPYVVDNVDLLKDLHADLKDDWLKLHATVDTKGIFAAINVDLKLVEMELNENKQLIIFEQISDTQIEQIKFDKFYKRWGVNLVLFFYRKVLRKDPLGPLLEKAGVLEVKNDLIYLDLNKWLGDNETVIGALNKLNVNHGVLKDGKLVVFANVDLDGVFNRKKDDDGVTQEIDYKIDEPTVVPPTALDKIAAEDKFDQMDAAHAEQQRIQPPPEHQDDVHHSKKP